MIYKPKGRKYFVVRFRFNGKLVQKRTRATNRKDAKDIASKIRSELALGNFGIMTSKPKPTAKEYFEKDFLPFVESKFRASKPKTADYYKHGVKLLLASDLSSLAIDAITDQHAGQFAAQYSNLSPSTVNCGLRTLRRALYLAADWHKMEHKPKITLAKGERQRERVLTREHAEDYLAACAQPWRDVAIIMLGTGIRPGEAYPLRWEAVFFKGDRGLIQITGGKSKAAKRVLPMIPEVYAALLARNKAQGRPDTGWVFPSGSASGHLEQSTAKILHDRALRQINQAHEIMGSSIPELKRFEPYCLRHTALTWFAESGCDAFTLARIAGHSSITITQRYCHPQAEAIDSAFAKLSAAKGVGNYLGPSKAAKRVPRRVTTAMRQKRVPSGVSMQELQTK